MEHIVRIFEKCFVQLIMFCFFVFNFFKTVFGDLDNLRMWIGEQYWWVSSYDELALRLHEFIETDQESELSLWWECRLWFIEEVDSATKIDTKRAKKMIHHAIVHAVISHHRNAGVMVVLSRAHRYCSRNCRNSLHGGNIHHEASSLLRAEYNHWELNVYRLLRNWNSWIIPQHWIHTAQRSLRAVSIYRSHFLPRKKSPARETLFFREISPQAN